MNPRPRALALYPRAYRTAHGAEIADHFAESTASAPRSERWREEADLASHALRLRLRLASDHSGGRMLAAAAPYAVLGAAIPAVLGLAQYVLLLTRPSLPPHLPHGIPLALRMAGDLVLAVAGLAAVGGRWRAARWLMLLGVLGLQALWAVHGIYRLEDHSRPVALAIALALALGCPPDTPPVGRGQRGRMAAFTALVLLPPLALLLSGDLGSPYAFAGYVLPLLVLSVLLAVEGARSATPMAHATGLALSALPWLAFHVEVVRRNGAGALVILGGCLSMLAVGSLVAWGLRQGPVNGEQDGGSRSA
ncbi:hypothetical protein [Streptomyces orinoci]|uniref:Uncharacterized protein n=1 Tax=Streptomyces orinoci TaxID=67339 RepID=A0ABV3K547_STRON|nr:hypothetical protein [Streptomyces orinoci]